jgi:glycosyltransferase involved in cell wall biosynthesis
MDPKNVSIIVPFYNEEVSLAEFAGKISDFAKVHGFELIFVNDGSTDNSIRILQENHVVCISHHTRYGYGASLKTGVKASTRDYVIFVDADGQHKLGDVLHITRLADGQGMVIGERGNLYRLRLFTVLGRFILTTLVNFLTKSKIHDINSGLRLVPKEFFLRYESVLPDSFSCTTTLTIIAIRLRLKLKFVPIEVLRRKGASKVNLFLDGMNLVMTILRTIVLLDPLAIFLPISLSLILTALAYGLWVALRHGMGIPVGSMLLFETGIIVFVLGVICDQISSLRLSMLKRG